MAAVFLTVLVFAFFSGHYYRADFRPLTNDMQPNLQVDGQKADFPVTKTISGGQKVTYMMSVYSLPNAANPVLLFHTDGLFFRAYVDGIEVNSFTAEDLKMGSTVGRRWNMVFPGRGRSGHSVRIEFEAPEGTESVRLPQQVYYSGYRDTIRNMWRLFLPTAAAACAIGVLSIVYILLSEFVLARMGEGHLLTSIGCTGLFVACWIFCQNDASGLMSGYGYGLLMGDYMAFIAMQGFMLMTFILYSAKRSRPALLLIPLSFFALSIVFLCLDLTGKASFAVTVQISIVTIALVMLVVLVGSLADLFGGTKALSTFQILLCYGHLLLMICGTMDIVRKRVFHTLDHSLYTRQAFLLYLTVVGLNEIRSFLGYWRTAQEAETAKRLAYVDGLTGIGNRMAFNRKIDEAGLSPEGRGMISLDVNRLKQANDRFGHAEGDLLIRTAAEAVNKAFSSLGEVFRYGGDEFVVIVENYGEAAVDAACKDLREAERRINEEGRLKEALSVACGAAAYEKGTDGNLEDTLKRADEAMYYCKRSMEGDA